MSDTETPTAPAQAPAPTPPLWKLGNCTVSKGMLQFLLPGTGLLLLLIGSACAAYLNPGNPLWGHLVLLVVGIWFPNPKIGPLTTISKHTADTVDSADSPVRTPKQVILSNIIELVRQHYTTTIQPPKLSLVRTSTSG